MITELIKIVIIIFIIILIFKLIKSIIKTIFTIVILCILIILGTGFYISTSLPPTLVLINNSTTITAINNSTILSSTEISEPFALINIQALKSLNFDYIEIGSEKINKTDSIQILLGNKTLDENNPLTQGIIFYKISEKLRKQNPFYFYWQHHKKRLSLVPEPIILKIIK